MTLESFFRHRECARLDAIFDLLGAIIHRLETIMTALTDLQAEVAATTTAEASAVTLIQGIAAQLQAALAASATPDPAIQALTDQLTASTTALAAAVTANTSAAP
jgi:hypothetical protein